jgi:hypothetical protein
MKILRRRPKQKLFKYNEDFLGTVYIKQLEYEGFSHSAAVYGVDNCNADWFEQAVKKGELLSRNYGFLKRWFN